MVIYGNLYCISTWTVNYYIEHNMQSVNLRELELFVEMPKDERQGITDLGCIRR